MRKILSVLTACVLAFSVFPAFCLADVPPLQWGMTEDEVLQLMGEPDDRIPPGNGEVTEFRYKNQSVSQFEAGVGLGLYNHLLFYKVYQFEDPDKEKYEYLHSALQSIYKQAPEAFDLYLDLTPYVKGESFSEEEKELLKKNSLEMCESGFTDSWRVGPETYAIILYQPGDSVPTTMLMYFHAVDSVPEYNYNGL